MRHPVELAIVLSMIGHAGSAAEPASSWAARAAEQVAEAEYEITPEGQAWQAPNRAQGFRTHFSNEGIRVVPRTEEVPSWEWSLALARLGRAGAAQPVAAPDRFDAQQNRATYERPGVVERYVNTREGLEQLFMIAGRPGSPSADRLDEVHLDLALEGTLAPAIAEDHQAIDFVRADGARVLHYGALQVTDALGHPLPSRFEGLAEAGLRGIRIVFDDRDAVYPVTVDPLTTAWAWSASGHQASAWFGYSVATAGDVNGDGYSDIVSGVPFYDDGDLDEGSAFVYLGSASGPSAQFNWFAAANLSQANFGWSVASAGDVNGDGYADVIVGAPGATNGQSQEGRAYVYLGSAAGLAASPAWIAESNQANALFGSSVASAGDVNGDGFADVIVSAPEYGGNLGRVYVYLGSSTGLSTTAAWTKDGTQDVEFGNAVATAGDVNGDGYADVIIGATNQDTDQAFEGRALVYLGSSTGLVATPIWTVEGNSAGAHFGRSVATAGDVNGDGYADVIVGADGYANGQSGEGRALVFLGNTSGLATAPAWSVESNGTNARFGTSVATAGDINGDGYADVVVGSPRSDGNPGRIDVYEGSATGLSTSSIFSSTTPNQAGDRFGFSAATAGDVNGDGVSDLIGGAYQYSDGTTQAGGAFVWLGSSKGLSLTSSWMADGTQADGSLGSQVAPAGDVNGDGYADVVVGAPYFDNGEIDEGRAFLYLGSPSGLATMPAWTAEGNRPSAYFGLAVGSAGDVNGDGYSDIVVGAPSYDNDQTQEGRAFVYYGSPSGLSTAPAWTAEGNQAQASFGYSVASAGDVNGDGYADVIIGASGYGNGATQEGRALLYLGSATGLAATPSWTAEGNQDFDGFGVSAASAGDVNGDGFDDAIVGAYRFTNGVIDEGRAFLYLGSPSGLSTAPAWTAEGNTLDALFGVSVASAGDVNGDGFADVIIGAEEYGNNFVGAAFVYLGSPVGLQAIPAWTVQGSVQYEFFGASVASAGDVNGDGYSDVVVGGYNYFDGTSAYGRAFVYLGSASGLSTAYTWTGGMIQPSDDYAGSVASAGDVNGDGYADVVIGAPGTDNSVLDAGRAYLYYGGGGDGLERIPRQARTNGVTLIARGGKSDSETGFRVRVLGRTPAGRGKVRLQWEVKPLGTLFNNSGLGASTLALTNSPGGMGSVRDFNESVSGLSEGTFYHWRARTVSPDPLFPRTRWIALFGNNVTETKLRNGGCVDRDGDGYGALGDPSCLSLTADCNDDKQAAWATPGQTQNLRFTSKTVLTWSAPAAPGAPLSKLLYDALRTPSAASFTVAACVESDDGPNTTATDPAVPTAGKAYFYLTRAQDQCPLSSGPLGTDSDGVETIGRNCP
jgi:hypothetical protein